MIVENQIHWNQKSSGESDIRVLRKNNKLW